MTDPINLTRFDRMSIAMAIMEDLKPEILEFLQQFGKDFLDHVAVGYHNTQAQKWREDRQRREHLEQRRFISDQAVPDPYMPPGGALNDVRVELNGVKGAVGEVLQLARGSFEQDAMVSTRLDSIELTLKTEFERTHQQLAFAHGCDAWLKDDEAEEEEVEIPDD